MAAKTIEPAIGASTWALGSHKCTENIGSFTKNPAIVINQNNGLSRKNLGYISSEDIVSKLWPEYKIIPQNIMNIGREAVIVYIIKYILACKRSG